MNKETKEYERVREEIATQICGKLDTIAPLGLREEMAWFMASQILSIKGIRIEADDQSLPRTNIQYGDSFEDKLLKAQRQLAQNEMLTACFVKVIKK